MHKAEVVVIEGDSYRQKEAKERLDAREKQRKEKEAGHTAAAAPKGTKRNGRSSSKLSMQGVAK